MCSNHTSPADKSTLSDYSARIYQGTLEVLVLRSLQSAPNHAYGIDQFQAGLRACISADGLLSLDDNSDSWIRFEWPIRAESVPQVCSWRDHRGPCQRLMAL
jgi:hypothetical protein